MARHGRRGRHTIGADTPLGRRVRRTHLAMVLLLVVLCPRLDFTRCDGTSSQREMPITRDTTCFWMCVTLLAVCPAAVVLSHLAQIKLLLQT